MNFEFKTILHFIRAVLNCLNLPLFYQKTFALISYHKNVHHRSEIGYLSEIATSSLPVARQIDM